MTAVTLASSYDPEKHGEDLSEYVYSNKIDGMRSWWCIKEKTLFTRNHKKIFIPEEWEKELSKINLPFDGELYVSAGKESFKKTMSICRRTVNLRPEEWKNVNFFVFDIIEENKIFLERFKKMRKFVPGDHSFLIYVKHFTLSRTSNIMEKHNKAVEQGFEGLMIRKKLSYYEHSRSTKNLLKIKKFETVDAEVINYQQGTGKYFNTMGALILKTDNGTVVRVGSGFKDTERYNHKKLFPIGSVIEFKYFEKTPNGNYRFPIFKIRRYDKEK